MILVDYPLPNVDDMLEVFPIQACMISNLITFEYYGKTNITILALFEMKLEKELLKKLNYKVNVSCKHLGGVGYEVSLTRFRYI